MRLDVYIAANSENITRSRARALIEAGAVSVNSREIRKASYQVDDSDEISVSADAMPYVSRGGFKLEGALDAFKVSPDGLICADIGASTGGFTDCLLKRGAKRVYALDSGSDQLSHELRCDSRVVSIENFNARYMSVDTFGEACDLAVADLSFISQTHVLQPIASILADGGIYIGLIKPQFECGREHVGEKGIVRDRREHLRAVNTVLSYAADIGFEIKGLIRSPITGGDGNTEFLYIACKSGDGHIGISDSDIRAAVMK